MSSLSVGLARQDVVRVLNPPFTLEHIVNVRLGDEVVVAFEPMIPMLTNVGNVMSCLNCTYMIDHSKKRIPAKHK